MIKTIEELKEVRLSRPGFGWPRYSEEEIDAVSKILASGRVNQWTGDDIHKFEERFSDYIGVAGRCLAVMNGTVALELALRVADIGIGDEVIVTPRSYVASASVVMSLGATPVFADVSAQTGNLTPETIEKVVTAKTKAVICVHLGGWPCQMNEIMELATINEFLVIEDCSQAHGAQIDGFKVGSFGHISTWSFCQDKIISTGGEGGMVFTTSEHFYDRMWSYRDHGKAQHLIEPSNDGLVKYIHQDVGSNLRMTQMQAAIGLIQLSRLDRTIEIRNINSKAFLLGLAKAGASILCPRPSSNILHAFYRLYLYLELNESLETTRKVRDRIISVCSAIHLPVAQGSAGLLFREGVFRLGEHVPRLAVAEVLEQSVVAVNLHHDLSEELCSEVGFIFGNQVRSVYKEFDIDIV